MNTTINEAGSPVDATHENEEVLRQRVSDARKSGAPVLTRLKTDERVFARITDGIYREPASALRELIANSYDADATEVRIETDAPRFSKIVVRDNGRGLSEEALVHVICHIGGSLKRTNEGKQFHVVSETDASVSPGGRPLIGKLGIGLFSVSQLTHHLIIVTKVRGENYRRVCDILLMPQREESLAESGDEKGFVTGEAQISTVYAEDKDSQGTEITLLEIRPHVRESLQSTGRWVAIEQERKREELAAHTNQEDQGLNSYDDLEEVDDVEDDEFRELPKVPTFHIGEVSRDDHELMLSSAKLPWSSSDSTSEKFKKLVTSINHLSNPLRTSEKVKLSEALDTYLGMLWTLSLSIPIPYVQKHPFDLENEDGVGFFALSNKANGRAEEITLASGQTVREKLSLTAGPTSSSSTFSVVVDDIELFRPVLYPGLESQSEEATRPLMFFGKLKTDLANLPKEYRGGSLEFEAYLSWKLKVVPLEHNGVMVRINGASGILFDEGFLKYQISELTRLRQVTAEIFITKGLDVALNIDRESFNVAHPHYQYISKWLHHALRQLMSRHKSLQQGKFHSHLENKKTEALAQLFDIVRKESNSTTTGDNVKEIFFSNSAKSFQLELPSETTIVFEKASLFASRASIRPVTKAEKLRESLFEEKIKAVATILEGYGLLGQLSSTDQGTLLKSIVEIFSVEIK